MADANTCTILTIDGSPKGEDQSISAISGELRSEILGVDPCPPKAKATRSNRVGCAIYTRARYRDLQASFPRCRVATLICESEESTRRWTSTLEADINWMRL